MGFRLDGVYEPPASRFACRVPPLLRKNGRNGVFSDFRTCEPGFRRCQCLYPGPQIRLLPVVPTWPPPVIRTMARRTQVTVPYHTWRPDRGSPVPRHRPRIHTGRGSEFCQTHATHVEFRVWLNEDNCQRTSCLRSSAPHSRAREIAGSFGMVRAHTALRPCATFAL